MSACLFSRGGGHVMKIYACVSLLNKENRLKAGLLYDVLVSVPSNKI
jgi:hypothetical protein